MVNGSDAAFVLEFVHSDEFYARKEVPPKIERKKNVAAQTNRSSTAIIPTKTLWAK